MTRLEDTHIENRQRVQPNHANNYGTVHGGNVMKWMDEIGAMSAMRLAGETCVTANIDEMDFIRPVPVGDTVLVESYVYDTGRTSVKVRLRASREEPRTGERERTTESRFVFVAIGDDGTPVEVPDLQVETDEERRLQQEALDAAGE
ncbi:acyl-CoA thioesterase [Halospeciosus flavus]|uniref:Acyl-CoA thioesterase n=1 Tax=Halospeciosus flavus TaxID=3032283 RepID=A0ABD5Z4D2_9EURY|nr:acyl-CoA thioesterase [Halospeciosus flavus]